MPTLIGGNTNAPTIMIGEKAADLLRSRQREIVRTVSRDRADGELLAA